MRKYIAEKYFLQETGAAVYQEIIPDDSSGPILLKIGKIHKDAICPTCNRRTKYQYGIKAKPSKIRHIEGICRKHKIKYLKLLLKGQERLGDEQKKKVNSILKIKQYRKLKIACNLKERIRHILNKNRDKTEAKQEFINLAHSDVWNKADSLNRRELLLYSRYYRTFIETLKVWEKEILTLIETRITNGYTEGIHTKIKLLKRMSYGISNSTTYIKRMILALSNDILPDSFHTI